MEICPLTSTRVSCTILKAGENKMTMFELSYSDNDVTRLVRADEIDTIECNLRGNLVVYLADGREIECDFCVKKEVEG